MKTELLEYFKAADMDGDQTLDYREFLAATMEKVLLDFCGQHKQQQTGTFSVERVRHRPASSQSSFVENDEA